MEWIYYHPVFEYERFFNDSDLSWAGYKYFAYDLIRNIRPCRIVIVGHRKESFIVSFCQAIKDMEFQCDLFAIESNQKDSSPAPDKKEFTMDIQELQEKFYSNIRIHRLRVPPDKVSDTITEHPIDLLIFDDQYKEEIINNFEKWFNRLSDNAVILFHPFFDNRNDNRFFKFRNELKDRFKTIDFHHANGLWILLKKTDIFIQTDVLEEAWRVYYPLMSEKNLQEIIINKKEKKISLHDRPFLHYTVELPVAFKDSFNKDEQIAILWKISLQKEKEILRLSKVLTETDRKIQNLEQSLHALQYSLSWRLLGPFRFGFDILVIMTRIVKYGIYFIKKEGFISFVRKLKNFLVQALYDYGFIKGAKATLNKYEISGFSLVKKTIPGHKENIDIIICVHNALQDVKLCLNSIVTHTMPPYHLIIINDGSDNETSIFLTDFCDAQGATLLYNYKALGYTFAANRGLRVSTSKFVMLLNSDTIIGSDDWVDRMIFCADQSPNTGVVSPLSNTASWQSVPEIFHGEDWADNKLPVDISIEQFAEIVSEDSSQAYPKIPFLNGFCLLIKRACLLSVGFFDEELFGKGYGEENDFCLRAVKKGWNLAVADDVFVYHAQSKSYSHTTRLELAKDAGIKLVNKHGVSSIQSGVELCRNNLILHGIRARASRYNKILQIKKETRDRFGGKKVLFILPVGSAGGGANVVIQELIALRDMDVDCYLANLSFLKNDFEKAYHDLNIPVIYFENTKSLSNSLPYFDAVIGTGNETINWIKTALEGIDPVPLTGYYIQDFEPYFYPEGSLKYKTAMDSYSLIPSMKYFTKTVWNMNEVKAKTGIIPTVISASVNLNIFRPFMDKTFTEKLSIIAMVRPETPRRAPKQTLELLKVLKERYKDKIEIHTFGCSITDSLILQFRKNFSFTHWGVLQPAELALLFNKTHIFIDTSSFQAMGLTGMEAMACANAVIMPANGGSETFIRHGQNGFLIDTTIQEECLDIVNALVNDRNHLKIISYQAVSDIVRFSPYFASANLVSFLFKSEKE
jgi:GT2 family glycosyltransferase